MHEDAVRREFTHQAERFEAAAVMSSEETLGALVALVPVDQGARWLEVACGPGLIARALATRVGHVHGVDLTPAMIETARRAATQAGLENVTFSLGDATALEEVRANSFDGVATRFSLHHIPVPGRVFEEMARVVAPGGFVIVADHLTDEDVDGAAWHEEIERLRDASHWACETHARLVAMGRAARLTLERESITSFELDFEEWLTRGSGGPASAALIERLLEDPPRGARSFEVLDRDDRTRLRLRYWLSRWRVDP